MDEWKLLFAVDKVMDAYMIRAQLELNEIEVQLKDDLTVQVAPGYTSAIGGIRIFVEEPNLATANEILIELGYKKISTKKPNKFLSFFDTKTKSIPILGKKLLVVRLFIFVALILAIIVIPFAVFTIPSLEEKLTSKPWCIYYITLHGKPLHRQIDQEFIYFNNCHQQLSLKDNGSILMPLYQNCSQPTRWACKGERVTILCENSRNSENDRNVLEGLYHVVMRGNLLELISEDVVISASKR
jgi:hypothetical protein